MSETASQRVTVVNRKGLHARASAKLARLAAEFDAEVIVKHEDMSADARSIMDLLMLVAHQGCELDLTASGRDAAPAVTALASLIADGFGERGEADKVY
jgi:phosphocarrier protein HPr